MMKWWYLAIHARGHPSQMVEQLHSQVKRHNLGDFIPRVCVERKRNRRRGEYYLFLGIRSEEEGKIPAEIEWLIPRLGNPIGAIPYDQIKPMVGGDIDISQYARTIKYRLPQTTPPPDPFSPPEPSDPDNTARTLQDATPYNHLLWWLSHIGKGSWHTFHQACHTIGLTAYQTSHQIFRHFYLLGHVEYRQNGTAWTICPSFLVQNQPRARSFLSGQQTPALAQKLVPFGNVSTFFQPEPIAPDSLCFEFESDALRQKGVEAGQEIFGLEDAGHLALKLCQSLPDLDSWRNSLPATPASHLPIALYTCKRWLNNSWVDYHFSQESGFYQLKHREATESSSPHTYYYHAPQRQWLRGDWYGLRFLAQVENEQTQPIFYNPTQQTLTVSTASRLPALYERAFVLSSGLLPHRPDANWLSYTTVTPTVATLLAQKLKLTIQEQTEEP